MAETRPLTERELEILELTVSGLSRRQIAERLEISMSTAANHLTSVYRKLGVHERSGMVVEAVRRGLVKV